MRTRFCATMRKPALSMIALIAPVRLRCVASGLMIEKVRSTAIGSVLVLLEGQGERVARLIKGRSRSGKQRDTNDTFCRNPERAFSPIIQRDSEPPAASVRLIIRMTYPTTRQRRTRGELP